METPPSQDQKIKDLMEKGCTIDQLYDLVDSDHRMKSLRITPTDPSGFQLVVWVRGYRYWITVTDNDIKKQKSACHAVLERLCMPDMIM